MFDRYAFVRKIPARGYALRVLSSLFDRMRIASAEARRLSLEAHQLRRKGRTGVSQEGLAALDLWSEASQIARKLEAALVFLDMRRTGIPLPVSLGTLSQWTAILECHSGVTFDGAEGILVPISPLNAPPSIDPRARLTPAIAENVASSLSNYSWRFHARPVGEGDRAGFVAATLETAPARNIGYAQQAKRDEAEDTERWLQGRAVRLRAPDWVPSAPPTIRPSRTKTASSVWALQISVHQMLWEEGSAERLSPLIDRIDRKLARLLEAAERWGAPDVRGLPSLDLYSADEMPFVVLEHPTAIRIGGQVGGMTCANPRVHGFAIPLPKEPWMNALGDIYHRHGECGVDGHAGRKMLPHLATAWPSQEGTALRIELNRREAREGTLPRYPDAGTEAWFPIVLRAQAETWASWLDGKRGWLLMPDNCD